MKLLLVFLGLLAITNAQLTSLSQFVAQFEYFAPTIVGRLTGTMTYDFANTRYLNVFDFQSFPLFQFWNHATNPTTGQVQYVWCSAGCDAQALSTPMPRFFLGAGTEAAAGTEIVRDRTGATRTCTRYTRTGDQLSSLSFDTNGPCRIVFADGREYRFSPGAKTYSAAAFTGVPPNYCPAKTCGIKLDLYQVLDESGSINPTEWSQLRVFSTAVVDGFKFDQITGIGMGVVTFSSGNSISNSARVKISLSFSQTNVRNIVINLQQLGGATCIGCGAQVAIDSRAASNLKRADATKTIILVTDGFNNQYSNLMSNFPIWRGNTAGSADYRNWIFFSIGVGAAGDFDPAQLLAIAGDPSRYITTPSYATLNTIVSQLITSTCVLQSNPTCPNCKGFCAPVACNGPCVCADCQDFNPCTIESCSNPAVGCVYPANPCNDGNACTYDNCDTSLGCQNPAKQMYIGDCRDTGVAEGVDNKCTDDGCDVTSGCYHRAITCFDGNACTDDTCNPNTGCVFVSNGGNCAQCEQIVGQPVDCTAIQAQQKCQVIACDPTVVVPPTQYPAPALQCKPIRNVTCNDNNACTIDTCDPATGGCIFTPVNETIFCSDNNFCTRDTCDSQTGCQHTPWNCVDGDPCTDDLCDNTTARSFDTILNLQKGCYNPATNCDDGNVCTVDTCGSNGCERRLKDCAQDPKLSAIVGTCYQAKCDPTISNSLLVNEGCYLEQIPNTTINRCGLCCGSDLTGDALAQCLDGKGCSSGAGTQQSLTVGGLFLAAILIAIIALCIVAGLLGGKKGYDIYLRNKGKLEGAQKSPLYNDGGRTGVNPLYDATN